MPNIFLISDTHFGHTKIAEYRGFKSIEEMDEKLIENWNYLVSTKDKVYHLGDVSINRRHIKTIARCNGDKVLIKGNHDAFKLKDYIPYFRDIRAYHVLSDMILSHIPIHPSQLDRFKFNVHGHLHGGEVVDEKHRYFCVSVENIGLYPISLDDLRDAIDINNFRG